MKLETIRMDKQFHSELNQIIVISSGIKKGKVIVFGVFCIGLDYSEYLVIR